MQILALQILRAIAAGLGVLVHAIDTYRDKIDGVTSVGMVPGLGTLGVKLFFCISGYALFSSATQVEPG
ncbi:MAG: hypothetical protein C4K60_12390 [Ideonella sp. MAG2]|nr:MAG: hypothetical protein C4K60_12390 [Ideonella sp. MAG2]